ncbi:MAG: sulfatase [Pirellulaceae bacterium]
MRSLLTTLTLLFLFCWPATFCCAEDSPNIILLMGDDHGWDETGYNGHPHLKTPVLDEMAASGLRLDRFYSAHPSCSPTRGSVITGRHPNRYGTFNPGYSLRPDEKSVATLLGKAGYHCGHFGKWHLGPVKRNSPTNPGAFGFHQWLSHDNFFELNPVLSKNGRTPTVLTGEGSQIIIDSAIEFIRTANRKGKPFFLVVWFGSPHEPYSGLPEDLKLYDDVVETYANKSFRLTSNETGEPTKRPLGEILRERYAEITAMDRSIGELRSWLDEQNLRENTMLWYCGDNGTPGDGIVTSPYRGQKGTMYDGGIRVPAVMEWPKGFDQPGIISANTVTSDILPTLCRITGIPLPERPLDGIDLWPILTQEQKVRNSPIGFWSFSASQVDRDSPYIKSDLQIGTTPLVKKMKGIYTRNFSNFIHSEITATNFQGPRVWLSDEYKLVVHEQDTGRLVELFDIHNDPAESANIASERPDVLKRMLSELESWQASVLTSLTGEDYE